MPATRRQRRRACTRGRHRAGPLGRALAKVVGPALGRHIFVVNRHPALRKLLFRRAAAGIRLRLVGVHVQRVAQERLPCGRGRPHENPDSIQRYASPSATARLLDTR
jgi:hypothetical protein